MSYIIAIDQGTTGTTAAVVDANNFKFIGKFNQEFPQIFPEPGQVEHNLNDIWSTVGTTIEGVLKKFNVESDQIKSIGITNQRETTCAFNKKGRPLANAIVWQDRRTSKFCNELKDKSLEASIKEKTGLPIDPYFSASKMRWLLKNNAEVQKAYKDDDLYFGTIDTFLLFKLTQGASFATDASNASRTLLVDIETCKYDNELLEIFEVPRDTLPEIKDSFCKFGETKGLSFLPDGIPITGILGDQQSALFGQAGISKGDIKCTYGTGSFILLNTGAEKFRSNAGLLTTVAYRKNGVSHYALEGSCYIAGAAVQWLRDNLGIISEASEIEALANNVTDLKEMKNILFLPFFTGIGSPYWNSDAKAAIIGITRDTNKSHIARACLEGIAFSINDLINAMEKDTGTKLAKLKVDGGAVKNNFLMKIQSNLSNLEIVRPKVIETTAYGAALAAAVGSNLLTIEEINKFWEEDKTFVPNDTELQDFYKVKKGQWTEAIGRIY